MEHNIFKTVGYNGITSQSHLVFPALGDGFSLLTRQLAADQTEVLFKLYDNITGDAFKIWFDDYRGDSYDRYPFIAYGNKVLLASDGGNVGIGTSAPSEKLEVNGNISVYDSDIILNNSSVNQSNSGIIRWNEYSNDTNISGAYFRYNGSDNYLELRTNTETTEYEHLKVYRGGNLLLQPTIGNVGIGTTSPTHKLEVNGLFVLRSLF